MPIRLPEGNAKEKRKKMVLKEGRIVALILILGSFALYWWYSKMIEEGKVFKIRTLPPLEAIPEAVGRCAEMGRPMFYCTGITSSLSNSSGAYTLASITILGLLSKHLAQTGVQLKLKENLKTTRTTSLNWSRTRAR